MGWSLQLSTLIKGFLMRRRHHWLLVGFVGDVVIAAADGGVLQVGGIWACVGLLIGPVICNLGFLSMWAC